MKKYHNFETLHIYNGEAKNKSNIHPLFGQETMSKYSLSDIIYTKFVVLKNYAFSKNVTNSYSWSKERKAWKMFLLLIADQVFRMYQSILGLLLCRLWNPWKIKDAATPGWKLLIGIKIDPMMLMLGEFPGYQILVMSELIGWVT